MFAFFILYIDYFKEINDRLEHAEGDAVLVEFARKLREQFGEEHIVGRIGGDEFMAFMPVINREMAEKQASKLVEVLRRQVVTSVFKCDVTVSIGVALKWKTKTDFETLYRQADYALYQAKKRGRNQFVLKEKMTVNQSYTELRTVFILMICLLMFHSVLTIYHTSRTF